MTTKRHIKPSGSLARHLPVLLAVALALPAAAQTATPPANDAKPGASPDDQPIVLSPFEVQSGREHGYLMQNTLAGTRLNNNLADLPSSITIVTKQQLEDTNSQNINDIFRYEANTEGASTYTPFTLVRSNLSDALGGGGGTTGNYTSAATSGNRVRGLSAVDLEMDNFPSISRIPFDSYNTQAVEILRGPNSIIFGTGSPAGIVNQERNQADAHATKVSGEVEAQVKSYGGFREYLNANIPVISERLAISVGQLYDSEGFAQKPSSDITRRQYAAFTLYPFKSQKTKISGSIERYSNYANDPNGVTPVDFVSPWINANEPVWNPGTDTVTFLTTGANGGTYAISNAYPNFAGPRTQALLTTATSPYFVPTLGLVATTHNVMLIDQGNLENFFRANQTGFSIPGYVPAVAAMTNAGKLVNEARMSISAGLPNPTNYATWYNKGVTSKDIYDWSSVNINSLNNTSTRATTYNLNFQQEILSNLNFQVAYFRQNLKQLQDAPLSQANATTLYVDTNQTLLDGRPNPHVGQPFVDVYASDVYSEPETNDNLRAMLDWEPDLRGHVPTWLNWLGHHRFLGIYTRHDDVQTNLRFRPAIDGGDANYLPTTATFTSSTGFGYPTNSGSSAIEQWFYLGGPSTGVVGRGASSPGSYNRPNYGGATSANIETYNYATNSWNMSSVNMDSLLFNTGGLSENLQNSKTFFWQSFLWNDRIVGSFGVNQDIVRNRNTIFPATNPLATLYTNGFPNSQYWYTYGPWTEVRGTTHTLGGVFHAFKDWAGIDRAADHGNYAAGLLRSISFTANRSGNFNPPSATLTDYFGNPLGKSQGKEKDYGIEIATPDNKLFLRATWFNTTNENAIVTLTSTARANYIDQTELKNWATKVVEIRSGQNPSDPNFGLTNIYPITAAMQDQISQLTGLPYNYGGNVGAKGEYVNPAATESGVAKGIELEVTYTPLKNWTMKFNWSKQKTTITGAAAQADAWVKSRTPFWNAAVASDLPSEYTLASGKKMKLANFWESYGYDSNVTLDSASGWTSTEAYYNSVVGSQLAIDEANNGTLAPNQRQYNWTYLTNYTIDRGAFKRLSFGGALRYNGRATAGYYGDTTHLNSTNQIAAPDITKPIYTPGKYHLDLWVAYSLKMPWVRDSLVKVQFNVADVTSSGYLQAVTYNMDGTPAGMRIVQPRTYSLSAKYEF